MNAMKQASDSLLTLDPIQFKASCAIPALPREKSGTEHRLLTPFNIYRKDVDPSGSCLPGLSCSPRSVICTWLGEGRIRSLLHGICLVLFAVGAALSICKTALGTEGLIINLKSDASIGSGKILLKDVADLQGSDIRKINAFLEVSLGPAPEFGSVKILSRNQIVELLQAAVGPLRDEKLAGASAVQIRLKGRKVEADEIASLVKSYLLETSSWKESEIEIPFIGNLQGMELPPEDATLRVAPSGAVMSKRGILAPIEIVQGGKTLRCYWITAGVVLHADVLAAARKIPSGKIMETGDLVQKPVRITNLRSDYLRSQDGILGQAARRSLLAGEAVTREDFVNPVLVKNGETVQLRLQRNGIVLLSRGRAEQDGKLGQIIRVRNLDFSNVLKAQVTGRSEVMLY